MDPNAERENLIGTAALWRVSIESAEKQLAEGQASEAAFTAYRALQSVPDAGLAITSEVISRAKAVIARLPADITPPTPMADMTADEALRRLSGVSSLISNNKFNEAKSELNHVLRHSIVEGEHAQALHVYTVAVACSAELKTRSADPDGTGTAGC